MIMRTMKLKNRTFLSLLLLGLVIKTCTENESTEPVSQEQNVIEMVQSSEMDEISASLEDVIIEMYEDQESAEAKGIMNSRTAFENCVTVSLDMEQNFRQLTVDFAEGGCIRSEEHTS